VAQAAAVPTVPHHVYVLTNLFSNENDLSGTVIFDPVGGPPRPAGGDAPTGSGSPHQAFADGPLPVKAADVRFKAALESSAVIGLRDMEVEAKAKEVAVLKLKRALEKRERRRRQRSVEQQDLRRDVTGS
jgi:hypothetical protein